MVASDNASELSYSIVFNLLTGIDNDGSRALKIYAHESTICIRAEKIGAQDVIEVYNLMGKKILHKKMTSTFERIELQDPSGMFIVRVKGDDFMRTQKIILE